MTLGAPLLFTEAGEQTRFRTRKHFALLIRLAVESGRKFTRDYLMDLLWPDVPAPRARHSLAQALTVVKAKVGPEHLIVQRTSIALVPGVVDADVRRLDSCEAEIHGPFLEGFELPVAERRERRFEAETLIGREREFSRLYDAWLEVRQRTPRIMVMVGDPGVGKTTLTNAFVSTCQMEGAAIARAQAYDAERELPFAVLAELIKQLTLQRAIGGTDPEALSELTRISPEIFSAFPGVPKPVAWAAEVIPLRLADAFLKAVEAGTEESPLVLVVDDIHAADNASAAILPIIARKLPHTRLLLILTARSNELRTVAAPSALASDSSIEAMRTLEVEPLSGAAAGQLGCALGETGEGTSEDVPVPRILLAGNGNPLGLELLTKEWLAHGSSSLLSDLEALNTQPVANIGIPRAIGAVFDRQIRRLDAPTRAALDLAAVVGRRR